MFGLVGLADDIAVEPWTAGLDIAVASGLLQLFRDEGGGDELMVEVVTNKSAKGHKRAIIAMIKGTQADKVIEVLQRLNKWLRQSVQEVTLDMAAGMHLIVKRCFPYAHRVVDRFHVQQLATEAVQEIRIKHRWQAIDEENEQIRLAKNKGVPYLPQLLPNGDSPKQLLARSRYLFSSIKTAGPLPRDSGQP